MNRLFYPLALFIGLRYTRARRKQSFVSFISLASMIGIAIGVLVLITVLSVMNGFETAMRDRILGMLAHVTLSENDAVLEQWRAVQRDLDKYSQVKASAPFIEKPLMLNHGDEARGVLLQAVLPEQERHVASIFEHISDGDADTLQAGSRKIILGKKLAEELKVSVGESVTVISPAADALQSGELPGLERLKVGAIFHMDMQNYDSAFAYMHLTDAQEIFEYGEDVTGLRLVIEDVNQAPQLADEMASRFSLNYPNIWVNNWTKQNENFFKAIHMQKGVMFVILLLIIAVAAFNLVSTLVMVVTDKEADIAILRTLGMSPQQMMQVFMVQGMIIGALGTLLGVVSGVALASNLSVIVPWIENLLNVRFISPDVYFISALESRINMGDVMLIAFAAFTLSVLATLYPAWRASKIQPAEALRYE